MSTVLVSEGVRSALTAAIIGKIDLRAGSWMRVKVRDLIKRLEQDGWHSGRPEAAIVNTHPSKPGRVTIPGHPGEDLSQGMIGSILKQAGLTLKDLK